MNYKNIISFLIGAVAVASFSLVAIASEAVPENLKALARELGCSTKEACRVAFEANFSRGLELANKYDVYKNSPEQKKLALSFQKEVLIKLGTADPQKLDEEILKIARSIIDKKPALALQLGIDQKGVRAAEVIEREVRDAGVSLAVCSRSADSLTREELVGCFEASKKLSERRDTGPALSELNIGKARIVDGVFGLEEALARGEYPELGKTPDQVGATCLQPDSPAVCDKIAKEYFGPSGVAELARARKEVKNARDSYLKTVEDVRRVENYYTRKNLPPVDQELSQPVQDEKKSEKSIFVPIPEKPKTICPAIPTVDSCPSGQRKVVSYSSKECGDYYQCISYEKPKQICPVYSVAQCPDGYYRGPVSSVSPEGCSIPGPCVPIEKVDEKLNNKNWKDHVWNFLDGTDHSYILNRNDVEYNDYISSVEKQCKAISKSKFSWRLGAGVGSTDNWQNFGIPDCSGVNVPPNPVTDPINRNSWANHTWKFIDGSTSSSILNRTDQGYLDYIAKIDVKCLTIRQRDFRWNSGAGVGSTDNWQNFGIPDCSGNLSTASSSDSTSVSSAATGCATAGGSWDIAANYCKMPTTCLTGQYMYYPPAGGTAYCKSSESTVVSTSSSSSSAATGCATAGGTWYSAYNYCEMPTCPTGQYMYYPPTGGTAYCKSTSGTTGSSQVCTGGQWWNGSACTSTGGSTGASGGGTYSGSCTAELMALLGSGCHDMSNSWMNSGMTQYILKGSNVVKNCSTDPVSGCPGSGSNYVSPAQSCTGGQYWNGSACVSSANWSANASAGCTQAGGVWDSSSNYCKMPNSSSSCTSGQYWNGSACVTSSGSGSYSSDPATGCAQAGGTWNSSTNYCKMPGTSFLTPSNSLIGQIYYVVKSLFR